MIMCGGLSSSDLAHTRWRKASRSSNTGANCVELAALTTAEWRKASRSGNSGANCVELASTPGACAVRDSKNASGPLLVFGAEPFAHFLATLKTDHHRS